MTQIKKASLLTALYIAQGLPHGFFIQALPTILRSQGASLPAYGLAHLLILPWALKFIWAPAVDLYYSESLGRRRSWLLPIQLTTSLLYVVLGFFSDDQILMPALLGFFAINILAATQDIATDGLAIDSLAPSDRGWANGIQVSAYRVGMIVSGVGLLGVFNVIGWSGVMLAMAGLNLLCTIPVFLHKEQKFENRNESKADLKTFVSSLVHFFRRHEGAIFWLAVLFVYKFAHTSSSSLMRAWLVDQKYDLVDIAKVMGAGGFVAGLFGAITGGWLAGRFDRKKLLVYLGALQSLAVASYLWPVFSAHETFKVLTAVSLDHFTSGLATTTLFTLMMDASSRERAASDYTVQASAVVVSQTLAPVLGGFIAGHFGYGINFAITSVIAIAGVIFTAWVLRTKARTLFAAQTLSILLAVGFFFSSNFANAQSSETGRDEFSLHTGPFLPRKVAYVREILEGWGPRYSLVTQKGIFEFEAFFARAEGTTYNAFSIDYRIDIPTEAVNAHFVLGGHADHFTPPDRETRYVGGWHFGGGFREMISSAFGFRSDFKYRFGPSTTLYIGLGLVFGL